MSEKLSCVGHESPAASIGVHALTLAACSYVLLPGMFYDAYHMLVYWYHGIRHMLGCPPKKMAATLKVHKWHAWNVYTRCRDGVKLLWCHSHLVWLVFEGSIPTCACFHSENSFVTCDSLCPYTIRGYMHVWQSRIEIEYYSTTCMYFQFCNAATACCIDLVQLTSSLTWLNVKQMVDGNSDTALPFWVAKMTAVYRA